jgi:hypothetical protein
VPAFLGLSIETREHVIVRLILGLSRIFSGLSLSCACIVAGCGNLIGLGGYGVADDGADAGGAGTANVAGSRAEGGRAGEAMGEGGASGASEGESGSAGASGAPDSCPGGCDDINDCTDDSCVLGACAHENVALGTACGVARSCDARAVCVRCRDTAAGSAQDVGCSPTAPVCLGTGLEAACAGCTTPADCNDGNECTTETCTSGKCVFAPVAAGSTCAAGVCNGTPESEKCLACADSAAGTAQDAGCTSAKPICDASGTPTCYECLNDGDCVTDNVSCTVETCSNHVCSHVPADSLCAASGDVCKPNKCDAAVSCKQVDISVPKVVIGTSSALGNGGFEQSSGDGAAGWAEIGTFTMIYDCGAASAGCVGSNGTTYTGTGGGDFVAWLGGTSTASVTGVDHLIGLPLGTVKLQVMADINFQTKGAGSANKDFFEVRLLNSAKGQVGPALYAASNLTAQTETARVWTQNGINATIDVSAYASTHVGEDSYISFWSSVDASLKTDFFIDNVRVTATVCQ